MKATFRRVIKPYQKMYGLLKNPSIAHSNVPKTAQRDGLYRYVILLRDKEGLTLKAIGEKIGTGKEKVRQIYSKASKLRDGHCGWASTYRDKSVDQFAEFKAHYDEVMGAA